MEPPGLPPDSMSSAMYSINDICERLKSGAEPELKPFTLSGPIGGPGASSRCTLNDVMVVALKKDVAIAAAGYHNGQGMVKGDADLKVMLIRCKPKYSLGLVSIAYKLIR